MYCSEDIDDHPANATDTAFLLSDLNYLVQFVANGVVDISSQMLDGGIVWTIKGPNKNPVVTLRYEFEPLSNGGKKQPENGEIADTPFFNAADDVFEVAEKDSVISDAELVSYGLQHLCEVILNEPMNNGNIYETCESRIDNPISDIDENFNESSMRTKLRIAFAALLNKNKNTPTRRNPIEPNEGVVDQENVDHNVIESKRGNVNRSFAFNHILKSCSVILKPLDVSKINVNVSKAANTKRIKINNKHKYPNVFRESVLRDIRQKLPTIPRFGKVKKTRVGNRSETDKRYKSSRRSMTFVRRANLRHRKKIHLDDRHFRESVLRDIRQKLPTSFGNVKKTREGNRLETDKRYKCSRCSMMFVRRANLRHHEKIHLGDRPFQCDKCGKSFSRLSNMKRHKLIHARMVL